MSHGTKEFSVLKHRTSRHSLNDPTCFFQEFFICDLDHEALIRILMVHIDPGDLCGIFFYFAVCAAENRCGSNFQILFVTYRNLLQIQIFHLISIHSSKNAVFTVFGNLTQDIVSFVSDQTR